MRYIANKFVLTVVMFLSATTIWAADEVTVIKKLNGTTNSGAGTVTSDISNGKCTLTVTPANGNYITVDYITAERVVSGGVAQAPRRRSVGMDNNIVVSAVSSSADPSGETKYTFDMPGADYNVEVIADFQSRTSISGATITLSQTTFIYDGDAKTPAIQSVIVGGKTLATNDYSFEYSDNVNAGTATVTLTGQRTYMGSATAQFTISKATITPTVTLQGWTYGSDANTPVVEGNLGKGAETFTYAAKGSETFSENVPTNAGTYIVKATIAETANYQGAEATAEFSISKAAAVLTKAPVAIEKLAYTGQAQALVTAGEATGGELQYKLGTDGTYGTSIPTATNTGTYTIYYKVAGDNNHTDVAEASVQTSIGKAAINPTVTLQGWIYGSDANTPVVEGNLGKGAETFTYAAKGSETFSENVPTNAGTYIVKATIAETANYQGAEATAEFSISKAAAVLTKAPVAIEKLAYTGQAQALVTAGEATGGELQYKLGTDGTYGTSIPTATNTGTYTIYYKVAGDNNHTDVAEASVQTSIGKAAITPTVTLQGWIYGSDANTPVVEGNLGKGAETFTYAAKGSETFSENVPTNAGTYIVKATIAETANYQGAEATAEFSISKAAAVLTKAPTAIEKLSYTGQAQALITAGEATGGELQYKLDTDGTYGTSIPTATNTGTYTIYYKVVGDDNHTDVAEASVQTSIGKAAITPTVTLQGWTYGSDANTPVVEGNLGKGAETFTYAAKGSETFSEKAPTNAGTYIVKATIAETANYQGAEATAEFSISKAAAVLTKAPTAIEKLAYTGQAQALVTAGEATGGELQYKLGADGTYGTSIPTATNTGTYTIYYKVVGDDNHTDVAEASVQTSIGKAAITPTVTLQGWTYGSDANTPVVEGNLGKGAETFTYAAKGSETFSEKAPTEAGTYIVKATIDETSYYNAGEATAEFTISKADFSEVQIADIADQEYTGSAIEPAVKVTYKNKEVSSDEYTVAYKDNVDAGTATVTLMTKGVNFVAGETNPTKTFQILAQSASITGEDETVIYNGKAQAYSKGSVDKGTLVVTYYNNESDRSQQANGTTEAPTNAGVYYVQLTQGNKNYISEPVNVTFTIKLLLTVNGVSVTDENRRDILNDGGTMQFNGKETLVLTSVNFTGEICSWLDNLTVYMKNENTISGSLKGNGGTLKFTTEGNEPGKLVMKNTDAQVISGFSNVSFEQNLTVLSGSIDGNEIEIGTAVKPIVNESDETNNVNVADTGDETDLSNTIINEVLYTLDQENEDGVDSEENCVVLASTMVEDDVNNVIENYTPGTEEFAKNFAGLTFMVPAGYGKILITAKTGAEGVLNVQIGTTNTYVIKGALDFTDYEFPYACTEATYVYIYSSSPLKSDEVEALADHRAGKKTTVTVGVGSVGVSSNEVQTSSGDDSDAEGGENSELTEEDIDYDMSESTIVVDNAAITSLPDNAFESFSFVKFIDLRNTSITGLVVSREEGPFKGVSANTIIYLPAGNSSSESNVVIGSVCQSLVLDGQMSYDDGESFGLSGSFMAQCVEFDRPFNEGEMAAVYLPIPMSATQAAEYGKFYAFKSMKNGQVELEVVEGDLAAHTPYLFLPVANHQNMQVAATMMAMPEESAQVKRRASESDGLYGTYEFVDYNPFDTDVFRMVPSANANDITFQRLKSGEYVTPFECYLYVEGATGDVINLDSSVVTGIFRTMRAAGADYPDQWHGLSGVRVRTIPTQNGVYIHQGKKTIVK